MTPAPFCLLAALRSKVVPLVLALFCCLSSHPLTSPAKTRVEGSDQLTPGRFCSADSQAFENAIGFERRGYESASGRPQWLNRDPINELGNKLHRQEVRPFKIPEELLIYAFTSNDPLNVIDKWGLGHNFGRCWNYSSNDEWALDGGRWQLLRPGESTGVFGDCDGMTCGGGFYAIPAFGGRANPCKDSPDDPDWACKRWTPSKQGSKANSPEERGSREGNTPPGYLYYNPEVKLAPTGRATPMVRLR